MPTSTRPADHAQRWFLAGAIAALAVQVLALIGSRTILAFGDEQFELVGAIAGGAALLIGCVSLIGGAAASRRSEGSRSSLLAPIAFVVATSILPAILWRAGGLVVLGLGVALVVCAITALIVVLVIPRRPLPVREGDAEASTSVLLPAVLWAVYGALLALLAAIEIAVVLQAVADPFAWAEQVTTDFDGPSGVVLGRELSTLSGVIAAPLLVAFLAWVFFWLATGFSRPRSMWSVEVNAFSPRGTLRLVLLATWAIGLLLLQFIAATAWAAASGGGSLPQTVTVFFAFQQVFIAPILGTAVMFAVRGAERQRPLAVGAVIGAVVAIGVLAISIALGA